jgi:hypothetical protein
LFILNTDQFVKDIQKKISKKGKWVDAI